MYWIFKWSRKNWSKIKLILIIIYSMSELSDKDKLIKEVYENVNTGYGSIKDTYQQVKKKTIV